MYVSYLTNILFILMVKLGLTDFIRDPNECKTWAKEHVFIIDNTSLETMPTATVTCNDFTDLKHPCNQNTTLLNITLLYLYQTREILFDNNIDLRNILNMFQFSLKPNIVLHKLKGFNQVLTETRPVTLFENYTIMPIYSNFAFYKNRTLVSPKECSHKNFNPKMTSFFGSMEVIVFSINTFYTQIVCPYVFMNSRLKLILLDGISNSLIFENRLEFVDINETHSLHIQSLQTVALNIYFEQVTHKILNRLVFKQVKYLVLEGIIYSFQTDLFQHFTQLKRIVLDVVNLQSFLHTGIAWANSLNSDLNEDPTRVTKYLKIAERSILLEFIDMSKIFSKTYDYPEEDWCLFKNFPHRQLVVPLILAEEDSFQCTCTIIWLMQYTHLFINNDYSYYATEVKQPLFNLNRVFRVKNCSESLGCNFTQRFRLCMVDQAYSRIEMMEPRFFFKWFVILCLVEIIQFIRTYRKYLFLPDKLSKKS